MDRLELETLLDRIAEGDAEAELTLIEHIMEQPEGIRVLALEALRDGGDATREQLLLTLADDPDLVMRARPRRRYETPIDDEVLDEAHPIARQAAREWERETLAPPPPPALLEQLAGGDRFRAAEAARALAGHAPAASVPPLVARLLEDDRVVATAAIEALQEIGGPAVPALLEALEQAGSQARWNIVKTLSTIGSARAVPALVATLEDPNYGTRWLAAEGLVNSGRAALRPLLTRLAERKPSAWLTQGAWHVLNKLRLDDDRERERLRALGVELKRASAAAIPALARAALESLDGQDRQG